MNEKSLMLCASVTKGETVVGGKRRYERLEQPKVSSSLGGFYIYRETRVDEYNC